MKVSELIEKLKDLPPDTTVIMSKDGEGNEYSPLADLGDGWYVPESTWSGDLYSDDDIEEACGENYKDKAEKVVCLWPTN